jgi:hypothetical protein
MMSLDFSPAGKLGEGPIAQISCGRYMPDAWPEAVTFRPPAALQVCCERGVAFIDLPANLVWFDAAGRHMESLDSERPVGERLLMHFYRAVTSLLRKTDDVEDAYRALSIVLSSRKSFDTGQRIYLPSDADLLAGKTSSGSGRPTISRSPRFKCGHSWLSSVISAMNS